MRVMIVDDDASIVEMLRMAFEDAGFEIAVARDGVDAIAAIASDEPDAIVLDVYMPRLDGLSVLARLRGAERTRALPVVVLSARHELFDEDLTPYRTARTRFIPKPSDVDDVVAAIRGLLAEPVPVAS